MGKIIGFTYDLKSDVELKNGDPSDLNAELDKPETLKSIAGAFESAGHTAGVFPKTVS